MGEIILEARTAAAGHRQAQRGHGGARPGQDGGDARLAARAETVGMAVMELWA